MSIYICYVIFFIFKDFPIRLKENLQEEDNLSTSEKWPIPNVSFVWKVYCTACTQIIVLSYLAGIICTIAYLQ